MNSVVVRVAIVVLGVVIMWRWPHRPGGYATRASLRDKSALEIHGERHARGEIDTVGDKERRTRIHGDRHR